MLRARLAVLLAVVALVAAACGSSATDAVSEAATGTGTGADGQSNTFEGEFPTLDGGSVNLAEFEGQDVVLWFWAPW